MEREYRFLYGPFVSFAKRNKVSSEIKSCERCQTHCAICEKDYFLAKTNTWYQRIMKPLLKRQSIGYPQKHQPRFCLF